MPLPALRDAELSHSVALPASDTSVVTAGFHVTSAGYDFNARAELLIEAPALAVGQLANGSTMTYTIEHATDAAFTSPALLYGTVLTQTGAGGVGAAAATKRVALPSDVRAYVRLKATNSADANASAAIAKLSLLF